MEWVEELNSIVKEKDLETRKTRLKAWYSTYVVAYRCTNALSKEQYDTQETMKAHTLKSIAAQIGDSSVRECGDLAIRPEKLAGLDSVLITVSMYVLSPTPRISEEQKTRNEHT